MYYPKCNFYLFHNVLSIILNFKVYIKNAFGFNFLKGLYGTWFFDTLPSPFSSQTKLIFNHTFLPQSQPQITNVSHRSSASVQLHWNQPPQTIHCTLFQMKIQGYVGYLKNMYNIGNKLYSAGSNNPHQRMDQQVVGLAHQLLFNLVF